ncbi:hypothetical protein [uncultured Nostoc sp.]|uniref:hypothetical protein n=1 Tax=uncultured Nostoc sp. TaxID=340711 RepID=UPI0035CAB792
MKLTTLINSTVIIASLALTSGIASAQTPTNKNYVSANATSEKSLNTVVNADALGSNSTNISYIKPFNLVNFAYQGGFKQQGVPSGGRFIFGVQRGNITPEYLVKAAINAHRLPIQVLNDQDYISAVSSQLGILTGINYPI